MTIENGIDFEIEPNRRRAWNESCERVFVQCATLRQRFTKDELVQTRCRDDDTFDPHQPAGRVACGIHSPERDQQFLPLSIDHRGA